MMKQIVLGLTFSLCFSLSAQSQQSIARRWNEVHLDAIREDLTRVPVQARNLFHAGIAAYDSWALYDSIADPFLIGNSYAGYSYPIGNINSVTNVDSAKRMAISYAIYRVLVHQFRNSPEAVSSKNRFDTLMQNLGYSISDTSTNYSTGSPASLGNWVAQQIISMKYTDGSEEINNFAYQNYFPLNQALDVTQIGNSNMFNLDHWQPLNIPSALDQSGNPIPSIQIFDSPDWGLVEPFALSSGVLNNYTRFGSSWNVYHDPGPAPILNEFTTDSISDLCKWGHSMVAVWASHLSPDDTTQLDISPASLGNIPLSYLPIGLHKTYYDFFDGGDTSTGHSMNPTTNMPYASNVVKRGDYSRVASQYWADGPESETPPGHWHLFLNEVMDVPGFQKKWKGQGPILSDLEWDIKAYFTLGASMHDAAVTAWSIKGWHDSPRPISIIRRMAEFGQSSDTSLTNYHPAGFTLMPNYIEQIDSTDVLAGSSYENVGEIKLYTWNGFDSLPSSNTYAGVGWILAKKWMPYQRPTFVSPPFGGYVSGHSTFSRAGAEVLTQITGSAYFPNGIMEHTVVPADSFLVFESGPSQPITLQWATYYDASNEASLSRIWGGIHPPFDDMYGRVAGEQVAQQSLQKAETYFDGTALPVQLISFTAQEKNCNAIIKWTVAEEYNLSEYNVMSSVDGIHFDNMVATVVVENNTQEGLLEYEIIDEHLAPLTYYQLREKDITGQINILSNVISLASTCNKASVRFRVYPNPVHNELNCTASEDDKIVNYEIWDLSGQKIYAISESVGQEKITIPMIDLVKGIYLLKVQTESGLVLNRKVIKK